MDAKSEVGRISLVLAGPAETFSMITDRDGTPRSRPPAVSLSWQELELLMAFRQLADRSGESAALGALAELLQGETDGVGSDDAGLDT